MTWLRYSDSVEVVETRACFLPFQKISTPPRNIHHSVIERQISTQPTQFKLLKPTNHTDNRFLKDIATSPQNFLISFDL